MSWLASLRSLIYNPPKPQANICRAVSSSIPLSQEITENPYYEKYAERLAQKQNTPEDIAARLKMNAEVLEASLLTARNKTNEEHLELVNEIVNRGNCSPHLVKKDLAQIMKLDILQDKTAEEIELIWTQYHQDKPVLYAVLPGESFAKMQSNLKEYPSFLFPLPREAGYEYMLYQFSDNACYFTSLSNYQEFGGCAPVCLTLSYYTEFQADKGIVLMRGEYEKEVLKAHEAKCLTNQLKLYFGSDDEDKLRLAHDFNEHPELFNHMDLISNFEQWFGKYTLEN